MIPFATIFVGMTVIVGALLAVNSRIVNARGIFIAYAVGGALVPAISFIINRETIPEFIMPFDNKTIVLAIVMIGIFSITSLTLSAWMEREYKWPNKLTVYKTNISVAFIFARISIFASILHVSVMAYLHGGILLFVQRMYKRVSLDSSVANGFSLVLFAAFVFAVFAFTFSREEGKSFQKYICNTSVIIAILLCLCSGGRSMVVLFLFALIFPYLIKMKFGKMFIFSGVSLVLVGFISFIMINLRYQMQGASILENGQMGNGLSVASTGLEFLDHVALAIEYTKYYGYDYGQLYLNVLGQPIPRDIWTAKPLQVSVFLRYFLFGDISGGIPPGIIGESYISFGIFGPILAAIVFSWILARVNRVAEIAEFTDCKASAATAGVLVPLVGYALVRGGFDIAFVRVGIPAFWCICAYWIARRTRRSIACPVWLRRGLRRDDPRVFKTSKVSVRQA